MAGDMATINGGLVEEVDVVSPEARGGKWL
jgi:hypothetical protein